MDETTDQLIVNDLPCFSLSSHFCFPAMMDQAYLGECIQYSEKFEQSVNEIKSNINTPGHSSEKVLDSISCIAEQLQDFTADFDKLTLPANITSFSASLSSLSPTCRDFDEHVSTFVTLETEIEDLQKVVRAKAQGEESMELLEDFYAQTRKVLGQFEQLEHESHELMQSLVSFPDHIASLGKTKSSLPGASGSGSGSVASSAQIYTTDFDLSDLGISEETRQLIEGGSTDLPPGLDMNIEIDLPEPFVVEREAPIILMTAFKELPSYIGKYLKLDQLNGYMQQIFDGSCEIDGQHTLSKQRAQDICKKNPMYLMALELLKKVVKSKDKQNYTISFS